MKSTPEHMTNNYDKIARYYDSLSRLVFFKSQVNAQIHQLQYIPQNSNILIIGGGTGWILEELAKVHPEGLQIKYIEISAKMIELSRKRNPGKNKVEFINQRIEDFSSDTCFDVILTPFLFDNFSEEKVGFVFNKLDSLLKEAGQWLFVDFSLTQQGGKFWKSFFLKLMYVFFRIMGIVETSKLTDTKPYFEAANYKTINEKHFYAGFIQSSVYQKRNKD